MTNRKQEQNFRYTEFGKYTSSIEKNFNNFYADSISKIAESIEKRNWDYPYIGFSEEHSLLAFKTVGLTGGKLCLEYK